MTTPSPKPTCPTCGRMPSERFGEDFAKCEYPGDGETHGPMVEYVPTGYVTARCPDPIHDLADRLVTERSSGAGGDAPVRRESEAELHTLALDFACFIVNHCQCKGLGYWRGACSRCTMVSDRTHEHSYETIVCEQPTCVAARNLIAENKALRRESEAERDLEQRVADLELFVSLSKRLDMASPLWVQDEPGKGEGWICYAHIGDNNVFIPADDRGQPVFTPEIRASLSAPRSLEGTMRASVGDWIIRGVNGEFYPCKPDIFAMTYEPAQEADRG